MKFTESYQEREFGVKITVTTSSDRSQISLRLVDDVTQTFRLFSAPETSFVSQKLVFRPECLIIKKAN